MWKWTWRSQVLLDSGITAVDESQMFKIVFSPEKVICEVPFYEKTEKETNQGFDIILYWAVDKVRDDSAPDGRGEYLRIFDEEMNILSF